MIKKSDYTSSLPDSGAREVKESGFTREPEGDRPDYTYLLTTRGIEIVPPELIRRIAEHYYQGGLKYAPNNWRKGTDAESLERNRRSAARHFAAWLRGDDDADDHLAAVTWNMITYEINKGTAKDAPVKRVKDVIASVSEAFEKHRAEAERLICEKRAETTTCGAKYTSKVSPPGYAWSYACGLPAGHVDQHKDTHPDSYPVTWKNVAPGSKWDGDAHACNFIGCTKDIVKGDPVRLVGATAVHAHHHEPEAVAEKWMYTGTLPIVCKAPGCHDVIDYGVMVSGIPGHVQHWHHEPKAGN